MKIIKKKKKKNLVFLTCPKGIQKNGEIFIQEIPLTLSKNRESLWHLNHNLPFPPPSAPHDSSSTPGGYNEEHRAPSPHSSQSRTTASFIGNRLSVLLTIPSSLCRSSISSSCGWESCSSLLPPRPYLWKLYPRCSHSFPSSPLPQFTCRAEAA